MHLRFSSLNWLVTLIGMSVVVSGYSQAAPMIFEKFGNNQGLPHTQFRLSLQDRKGLIWMGGADGLASYDGYSFKSFRHSNADSTSLSGNNISCMYEDSKGRLWVGTLGGGIDVSDISKSAFKHIPVGFRDSIDFSLQIISDITEDSTGVFWLVSDTALFVLEEDAGTFKISLASEYLDDLGFCQAMQRATQVFTAVDGRIWIGTQFGIGIYDRKAKRIWCPEEIIGIPERKIEDIGYDRKGRMWVSCNTRPIRLYYGVDEMQFQAFDKLTFEIPASPVKFAFDLDNRMWVSAFTDRVYGYDFRDSTVFLDSKINTNITHERFLRNPLVDHSGNVWLHGEGYMIYRYPKGLKNYLHPYSFFQSNTCIYGETDKLWLGYREQGIVCVDKRTNTTMHFSTDQENIHQRIPANHIADILRLRSGNMLVVSFSYIIIMNEHKGLVRVDTIPGTNRAGFQDSKGRIWIGGFMGLHLYSEAQGVLKTYTLPPRMGDARNFIQAIVEDQQGNIWFASGLHGLARLQPETGEVQRFVPIPRKVESLPSGNVLELAIDKNNILWIATDVALVRFDVATHHMTSYDRAYGFESDYMSSVICGKDGNIWVSTNSGISMFDPNTSQAVNFSLEDGLLNNNYYVGCRYQSADGTMYFGGENGIDFFHPADLRKNPTEPRMYLTEVTIDNFRTFCATDLDTSGILDLSYNDDQIEIAFTGMHFAAQNKVQYAYRLDGVHDEWVQLGTQRRVVFSDLAPGEYVFRAKAMSEDGVWSSQELVIPMYISPPFYATIWFRILGLCVLAASLFGYIKYREHLIQRKERHEADIARRITELEKRALQAQMNPHFIYNCMNSIQQFMILHDFEGAMKYLTRFSRLLRMVLNMSAQPRIALSDEIKLIEDYLELENMRFPDKFSYTIEVSPELNIHTAEIPPFFIQPQVENAIRHGLISKSSPGHLLVKIDKHEQQIRIIVEDNGIGRESARANNHKDRIIHESKGLTIVQERLAHIHSENGHYPFQIIDLYDTEGTATGTRVEITLPLE